MLLEMFEVIQIAFTHKLLVLLHIFGLCLRFHLPLLPIMRHSGFLGIPRLPLNNII